MSAVAPQQERRVSSRDLHDMLSVRYSHPEWMLEGEITLNDRRLDAVAFNLWAARGRRIVGFELKTARADFMRELSAFEKGEVAALWCDTLYFVVTPGVCTAEEVPDPWGLLVAQGSRLITRKHPRPTPTSPTMPRELAARLFDRIARKLYNHEITSNARDRVEVREELRKEMEQRHLDERAHDRAELNRLRKDYGEIVRLLGVDPSAYQSHEAAMRAAGVLARYDRDGNTIRRQLEAMALTLEGHAKRAREALAAMDVGVLPL